MPEIYVGEEHSQVYDLWRERGWRGLRLSHIDFHCDMRGLLIDRRRGRAYLIDSQDARMSKADSGNFLAHAVMAGIVTSVRWVHDDFGGRRYDVGTVKYEGDLTAMPHRLVHRLERGAEVVIEYDDLSFASWDGVRRGEHLDIDWDGLASVDYDRERIARLTTALLARDFPAPETTYLVYSPGYSHPDRTLFDDFLTKLAAKFGADVRRLPPYTGPPHRAEATGILEGIERRVVLALHRVGIY